MELENILKEVAEILEVDIAKIEGKSRFKEETRARFCYYIIAYSYTYNQDEITKLVNRDRSAIPYTMRLYRNIQKNKYSYPDLFDDFKKVEHLMSVVPLTVNKMPVSRIAQLEAKVLELELIVNELKKQA